jgi:peptidoglycan/LPS O-acetylase OafA/YrhL
MSTETLVLAILGLALHVAVGLAAGRVLAHLARFNSESKSTRRSAVIWVAGLLMMLAYGFLAGHLAEALRGHDVLLIAMAVTMLLVCLLTYLRRRKRAGLSR